ncbi:MAG: DNA mismatch repair protein MutS, partial [Hyphomicrobiales bacterium]|nr:DNA mismatch repair protein MutS [Hyphomicrobiales bacterium]
YLELTQIGREPVIRRPDRSGARTALVIDAATRTNLELVRSQRGEREGSLLAALDRTFTGAGARTLASRLANPSTSADEIDARLDAVEWLFARQAGRSRIRTALRGCPDLARSLARVMLGRGGPRDLAAIGAALGVAEEIAGFLTSEESSDAPPATIESIAGDLQAVTVPLRSELAAALDDELPLVKRDGGFVRSGYRSDLDETRTLRDDARKIVAALQAKYAEQTGVKSLKVRHNNVLGYFVEVTAANGGLLLEPQHAETFIHRQTLANAIRFTTAELGETEARIVTAGERAVAIELGVFDALVEQIAASELPLGVVATALAALDHYGGLAELAEEQNYVRPSVDDTASFAITGGRHPVVEQARGGGDGGVFVENDCVLTPRSAHADAGEESMAGGRIWLVTGPNMAGKSTFLRQNALIAIMAQTGSFVPARAAHIGVIDRIFSRVGASDDLAGGQSTFMVEMVETAIILNQAGERSFVILDEIGRGTATFDGLSIAWACVEHLHQTNRCRALFATHYHELTALTKTLDEAANVTMDVKEWNDEIVFLHKVVPGAADRSYGIHVAKLAGLPEPVIARASQVLQRLEGGERAFSAGELASDLPLFAAAPAKPEQARSRGPSLIETALAETNPDEMTPLQALELLYELRAMRLKDPKRN